MILREGKGWLFECLIQSRSLELGNNMPQYWIRFLFSHCHPITKMSNVIPDEATAEEDPYTLYNSPNNNNGSNSSWLERNAPTSISPALLGTGTFFGGILREYKLQYSAPLLKSYFLNGFSFKIKSESLFMFCATTHPLWHWVRLLTERRMDFRYYRIFNVAPWLY
mmetsp:Transcript_29668/g.62929  ORF Transcript_29668/g.62929 Transcript_29668/m.62929 type:complete len:166 (-) Transcript_29668:896-1393(-)